jgi:hypothetical protein
MPQYSPQAREPSAGFDGGGASLSDDTRETGEAARRDARIRTLSIWSTIARQRLRRRTAVSRQISRTQQLSS